MPEPETPADDLAAFWQYAGHVWGHPATRDRLMHWQDTFGADVILILFALWFPAPLEPRHWHHLQTEAAAWQTTRTCRTRALRRRLQTPERHALYRALLDLELRAEYLEALLLHVRARRLPRPPGFTANIDYVSRLGRLFPALPEDERRALVRELPNATEVPNTARADDRKD